MSRSEKFVWANLLIIQKLVKKHGVKITAFTAQELLDEISKVTQIMSRSEKFVRAVLLIIQKLVKDHGVKITAFTTQKLLDEIPKVTDEDDGDDELSPENVEVIAWEVLSEIILEQKRLEKKKQEKRKKKQEKSKHQTTDEDIFAAKICKLVGK